MQPAMPPEGIQDLPCPQSFPRGFDDRLENVLKDRFLAGQDINLGNHAGNYGQFLAIPAGQGACLGPPLIRWIWTIRTAPIPAHPGWSLVEMNVARSGGHEYNHYTSAVGSSIVHLMEVEDIVTQHIVHI